MPFSPELGMRVFDPQEGARAGQIAGQAFSRSFENAQNRQLEERKLAMMEEETRRKAALLNLQQMGLAELRDEVARGTPFQDALFKAGPKLFADRPEAIASAIEARAKAQATETYRKSVLDLRKEAAQSLDTYRKDNKEIDLKRLALEKERLDRPASAASAPAPVAIAREMVVAEDAVDQAKASGDKNAVKKAERYRDELKKAQSLSHRDPGQMAVLGVIKSAIGAIDRQLHGQWATHIPEEEKARLTQERTALMDQLRNAGETTPSQSARPAAAEPAPSSAQGINLRLGTVVEQGGKRYRYQGGPVDDPASYVEVK